MTGNTKYRIETGIRILDGNGTAASILKVGDVRVE
jgi:hypothetical protein